MAGKFNKNIKYRKKNFNIYTKCAKISKDNYANFSKRLGSLKKKDNENAPGPKKKVKSVWSLWDDLFNF